MLALNINQTEQETFNIAMASHSNGPGEFYIAVAVRIQTLAILGFPTTLTTAQRIRVRQAQTLTKYINKLAVPENFTGKLFAIMCGLELAPRSFSANSALAITSLGAARFSPSRAMFDVTSLAAWLYA